MARTTEIRLGQLLVRKKLCTLRQINEALLRQKHLRARNQNVPIGKLLSDSGAIDGESLREALAELGVLHLHCPTCRVDYSVSHYVRHAAPLCPRCKAVMVLSDRPVTSQFPLRDIVEAAAEESAGPASAPPPSAPRQQGGRRGDSGDDDDTYLGKVLGGCQILEKIARGGMGVVYKAKQLTLGRVVAIKILSRELARDEMFVRRFRQEALSAGQLNHGNIVHIYDRGEWQGDFYFVMEYVDGKNLKDLLKDEPRLDLHRAVDITIQVCRALRHAHGVGIIHRDIKPENIMITREGAVKLADLGLVKNTASDLTNAKQQVLGTPYYMAPEQAREFSKADKRSDIYSLGVTLYRMLTGQVPFEGATFVEIMLKAMDGRKAPIHGLREEVPAELEAIVDRMMQRSPDKRYQDIEDVMQDLARVMSLLTVPGPA